MAKVILREDALLNIVLSSIEVYKRESYGIVIGTRQRNNYVVSHAISFQSASRGYSESEIDDSKEKMLNDHLRYLLSSSQQLIGDYHSHPDGPPELSDEDIKTMKESFEGFLSLLVVPRKIKSKRRYLWKASRAQKSLTGSVGKFSVKIVAFYYDHKRNRIIKLPVYCPIVDRLNKKIKLHKKLEQKLLRLKKETEKKKMLQKKIQQKLKS